VRIIEKATREESKEKALTWWLMGAGGDKSFPDYLNAIGLNDNPDTFQNHKTKEQIIADANAILEMARAKLKDKK
jgi:hypothetical protein